MGSGGLGKPKQQPSWADYFRADRRAQVAERFQFLSQSWTLDPAEIRRAFDVAYGQLRARPKGGLAKGSHSSQGSLPPHSRPKDPSKQKPQPPASLPRMPVKGHREEEALPEVVLGSSAPLSYERRLRKQLASLRPRRPPFLVRNIQWATPEDGTDAPGIA